MRFSEAFHMDLQQASLDFIDVPLDTDLQFFIDPTSIRALKTHWGNNLEKLVQDYFSDIMRCIRSGDFRRASVLLSSLRESNSFHLGYSAKKSSGKALGEKTAQLILESLQKSKAAQSGLLQDLEDTALTIQGIASDRISDSVCNILKLPFIEYTQKICDFYNIEMSEDRSVRVWDSVSGSWRKRRFKLPVFDDQEVILIPKLLARDKISYSHLKFYRRYIIPEIRNEHLRAGTALVTLLRGKETVTATRIIEEFGQSKEFIEKQIVKYPDAIKQYKEELLLSPPSPLSHKSLDDSSTSINDQLSLDVANIKNAIKEKDENLYVESIKKLFLTIFYPSLFYPFLIRNDIGNYSFTLCNESRSGFFFDFAVFDIPSDKILVNIVMSNMDIDDKYLSDVIDEMDSIETSVCLLTCWEASNDWQKNKIRDLAKNNGKFIFIMNGATISSILDEYLKIGEQHFSILRDKFKELN